MSISYALREHDSAGALVWARKGLAAFAALSARFPDQDEILEELATARTDTGGLLMIALGDLKAAAAEFEQAAAVREKLLAAHPHDAVHRRNLMLVYGHTAAVLGNPFMNNLGDSEGAHKY